MVIHIHSQHSKIHPQNKNKNKNKNKNSANNKKKKTKQWQYIQNPPKFTQN